jgi:prefoldin subunit 5
MKDPTEVLRRKEAELQQLQEEVEALRMVGKLLSGDKSDLEKQENRGKILQMPGVPVNLA